jgi:RNA polymerase sigma-70 factor (ECF subfamily)
MIQSADRSSAFLDLFLKAEPRVYAYIRSQIPHRADAEDVLQETAATLWSKFDGFAPGTNFVAWAYQVARFKIQYYYDRETRERRLFSRAFVDLIADRTEEMADELSELQPKLAECMQRLPAADREVVERCYGSEDTLPKVAAQLGRPVNTVKSILKRARRALYDCIRWAIGRENQP